METKTPRLTPLFDVKLIKQKNQHFYQLGDDEIWKPGVTSALGMIAKPALIPWAVKMCSENIREALLSRNGNPLTTEDIDEIVSEGKKIYKKKSEGAADIGTRAHKAVDDIIRGIEPQTPLDEDIRSCVEAFLDWKEKQDLIFELGDTRIGSRLFGYGGSMDMIAFNGSRIVLIDLKTSKAIWDEQSFQLAAYHQAFKETYGLEVSDALILRVGKETPDFEVKKVANLKDALDGFLAALKLYNLKKVRMFE